MRTPFPPLVLAAFSLVLAAVLGSCAGPQRLSTDAYRALIPELEAELGLHPDDPELLGDLGEAYVQTGRYVQAEQVLRRARRLRSDDPRTIYYLGLAQEGLGDEAAAEQLYANHALIPRTSPYHRLLAGRHAWVRRALLRAEIDSLLAAEERVGGGAGFQRGEPGGTVAVFPFAYRGEHPQYAPLGRGLSEMLTIDLAIAGDLRVVERLRMQALLGELKGSQARVFEAASAPRLGWLLGSERVVVGSVDVQGGTVHTDVALWERGSQGPPDPAVRSAALDDLFRLEKEIAFRLIEHLGVDLTPAERERIERMPTRDLQAFLAYSQGLEAEDDGDFDAASAHFGEAARMDPHFEAAVEKAVTAEGLSSAGGAMENALLAGRRARALGAGGARGDLVGDRLTQLNQSLGGAAVPGEDSRDPTAEAPIEMEPVGLEPVPDPPAPPGSGN